MTDRAFIALGALVFAAYVAGYALVRRLVFVLPLALVACNGTALKRAADAGSVTVAAAAEARAGLTAWALERQAKVNAECDAACVGLDFAVCFPACRAEKQKPVDTAREVVRAWRVALETEQGLEQAAAALVNLYRSVKR